MSHPTNYPFRQALTIALQNMVAGTIVPALNASLAAQYAAQNTPSSGQVSFGSAQVRMGALSAVSEPTICIVGAGFENGMAGARTFSATYRTDLVLLLPTASENAPEDFDLVESAFTDAMLDGLTAGDAALSLNPNLSDEVKPLPTGSNFRDCYPVSADWPEIVKLSDGVTMVRRCVVAHRATVSYSLDRPNALIAL